MESELPTPQNNWAPLVIATTVLLLITFSTVSHYSNIKKQAWYVSVVCTIGWFFPFWIVILLPLDLASTKYDSCKGECKVPFTYTSHQFLWVAWRAYYWTSFCLTWFMIPMLQAYGNTGDFTFAKRIKSAIKVNVRFYLIYVFVGIFGLIYLVFGSGYNSRQRIQVLVMAMANSWGLLLVIIFMGYGLVSVPRALWFSGSVKRHLYQIYLKAPRAKEECIDSELEFNELAKIMNTIAHSTHVRSPEMKSLVKKMVAWFPFVLDPEHSDRDGSTHIPQILTEEYLVKLNQDMIIAMRMKDRKLALWKNLLEDAFYYQDILVNRENTDHKFNSTIRSLEPQSFKKDLKERTEWFWVVWIRPFVYRILAGICTFASVSILWSELTFNVKTPVISIVGILLEACGFNYAAVELIALLTLTYMCLCVYSSLFKFRLFNLYLLIPNHHTDPNSMLWFTSYMCKMTAPLCYNFVNLLQKKEDDYGELPATTSTAEKTVFSQFMGIANLLPFLGDNFVDWFPVLILLPSLMVLLNIQGRCLSLCGIQSAGNGDDDDTEAGNGLLNTDIADGKALIAEERAAVERITHPELGAQRGIIGRARNAFGTYASKYSRPSSPSPSLPPLSNRHPVQHSRHPSSLRSERDRHLDELLSGRDSHKPAGRPGQTDRQISTSSHGSTWSSIGDAVKDKIGGIFSKPAPETFSSLAQESNIQPLDENTLHPNIPSSGKGRVFGRMNPAGQSSSQQDPRSRSPSPNPFLMATALRTQGTHSNGNDFVSPFTRFEDNSKKSSDRGTFESR
ncbi:LMBR1-like membrane protein-domain-containing protein [Phycomyces nitens]|nr:LMBR1-like membrane protein-domain-containing protein [Phycomyces nitens]